jgi:hypothetical protein
MYQVVCTPDWVSDADRLTGQGERCHARGTLSADVGAVASILNVAVFVDSVFPAASTDQNFTVDVPSAVMVIGPV